MVYTLRECQKNQVLLNFFHVGTHFSAKILRWIFWLRSLSKIFTWTEGCIQKVSDFVALLMVQKIRKMVLMMNFLDFQTHLSHSFRLHLFSEGLQGKIKAWRVVCKWKVLAFFHCISMLGEWEFRNVLIILLVYLNIQAHFSPYLPASFVPSRSYWKTSYLYCVFRRAKYLFVLCIKILRVGKFCEVLLLMNNLEIWTSISPYLQASILQKNLNRKLKPCKSVLYLCEKSDI